MRKIFSKLAAALFALFIFAGGTAVYAEGITLYAKNPETGFEARVYDDAELFTMEEAQQLYEDLYELTQISNAMILTVTKNPFGYSESSTRYEKDLCSSVYDQFYGRMPNGQYENGIIFLIDMDTRWLYIYREGEVKNELTEGKCDSITDNAYSYAGSGDYFRCAERSIAQINTVINGGAIFEPMKIVSNLLIAMTICFIITYIIASRGAKAHEPSEEELLRYAVRNFEHGVINDILLRTDKRYNPPSSSSGGGGHGGGGGGGSHGGGGGHRF